jgi:hypothetical protein
MHTNRQILATLVISITCGVLVGCGGGDKTPLPGSEKAASSAGTSVSSKDTRVTADLPPGHPPTGTEPGQPTPLKPTGIGSEAELDRAMAKLTSDADKVLFERAFRQSFTTSRGERDEYQTHRQKSAVRNSKSSGCKAWCCH